jgi:hypothetical protein
VPEANIVADGLPGRVGDIVAMAGGRLRRLFWRVTDALDYLLTLARLRVLDTLAGPEPERPADQQRARERIERAFPRLDGDEPGAVIPPSGGSPSER